MTPGDDTQSDFKARVMTGGQGVSETETDFTFEYEVGERLETKAMRQVVTCLVLQRRYGLFGNRYRVRHGVRSSWDGAPPFSHTQRVVWRSERKLWREVRER